jgi:voltage-gated potassium channel
MVSHAPAPAPALPAPNGHKRSDLQLPRRRPTISRRRRLINWFFKKYEIPETIFMAVLALVYVGLAFEDGKATALLGGRTVEAIVSVITAIFLVEFAIRCYAAKSRLHYFKHHFFDLLAVLPTLQFLRLLGLARLAVLLRLIRIVRVAMIARGLVSTNRALGSWHRLSKRNGLTTLLILAFGFLWIGADLVYQFENGVNPQFSSYGDSLWWAFTTMATLGDGANPITIGGRLVAGALMVLGIACFGLVTATATTFFVSRTKKVQEVSNSDLMRALDRLEAKVTSLEYEINRRGQ